MTKLNLISAWSRTKLLWLSILLPWLSVLYCWHYGSPVPFAPPNKWSAYLLLIIISPIIEEIAFRGLLQELLVSRIKPKIIALVMVNLAFVMLHYARNSNLFYLALVFACGLIFSLLKECFASLKVAVFMHSYYNCCFILLLRLVYTN